MHLDITVVSADSNITLFCIYCNYVFNEPTVYLSNVPFIPITPVSKINDDKLSVRAEIEVGYSQMRERPVDGHVALDGKHDDGPDRAGGGRVAEHVEVWVEGHVAHTQHLLLEDGGQRVEQQRAQQQQRVPHGQRDQVVVYAWPASGPATRVL